MDIQFPDPNLAEDDGLVAVGGELSTEFLLAAYSQGLFPWFNEGEPILWWSPNPRMILEPGSFHCSKSFKQTINSNKFQIRFDEDFSGVIAMCSTIKRKGMQGTWITDEMINAYIKLHKEGIAHSVEAYNDNRLVGGLYGISIGRVFFGESMFHTERDASKIALYKLSIKLKSWNFDFIDVQQSTPHLNSLGAENLDRRVFLRRLKKALDFPTMKGKWEV